MLIGLSPENKALLLRLAVKNGLPEPCIKFGNLAMFDIWFSELNGTDLRKARRIQTIIKKQALAECGLNCASWNNAF